MIINKRRSNKLIITIILSLLFIISCTLNRDVNENNQEYFNIQEVVDEKINYESYDQKIYSKDVKSIKISTKNISTGEPCYQINSDDIITIDFDLLNENIQSIQYQLIHCNRNWKKSNLMEMEYIEGFSTNYIESADISYGPIQQYVHYNFELPNENLSFLKSGNYILKVFYENAPNNPLVTIKLFISEQSSTVDFNLLKSNNMEQRKYLQAYEVECTFNPQEINDPYSNIFLNVQQNHQEFDEHWISGPNFIKENKLVFLYDEDRFFDGSNEFRFFDISTFRNGSLNIEKIFFEDNKYHVKLKKDIKRSYRQYLEYKDLDGKFFTRTYDNDIVSSQGEYGFVKFELPIRELRESKVYIFGQLSNWTLDDKFLMPFDTVTNSYKKTLLLKQGYYNYLYVTETKEKISTRILEGAHFDANNEYIIKVYYQDPLELYDRLLTYQVFKINT